MQFTPPLTLGKVYYVCVATVASAIILSFFRQYEYDAECSSRPGKFAFHRNHLRNFHFFLFRQRDAVASATAITTLHIFHFQPIWVATLLYWVFVLKGGILLIENKHDVNEVCSEPVHVQFHLYLQSCWSFNAKRLSVQANSANVYRQSSRDELWVWSAWKYRNF